ncbi:MAG TPA: CoA transferase [Acidimicrobiia bacterium]|nr:CoA transferase [Acidimicrobiia bacterium]
MLDGIRVVDLSTEIAGPYCTKLLADAGADVVRVEPPGGDPLRRWGSGALYEFLNTSKRSVTGDPADAGVQALLAAADVIVASERFDDSVQRGANPALVTVVVTPFGEDGPWAEWAATEFTLQAWCGSIGARGIPEEPPLAAGGRIGEWMAGSYAGVAALAAVLLAARTGHGEHVDVAMLDSMSVTMNTYASVFAEFLDWPPLERPTRTIEIPSIEPSADGYAEFTTNSRQQWNDFLVLIGRPDLLDDEELARHVGRQERRAEVWDMIRSFTKQHTTADLLEQAALLRIPSGPVGNGATVTGFDHFVERGTFVENPTGRFVQPRVPYRISGLSPRPFTAAAAPGEHTGSVDWTARVRVDVPPARPPDGRPLDGVRVVDMTAWWAGPAAGHVLAALGADVVKVESTARPDLMRYSSTRPPTEDLWWEWGPIYHGANNGKRGITLDLTRPEGIELLKRIVAVSDVVLENFTPRVMDNFGLGWDTLRAVNPRLVMTRMPAYGLDGPWRDRTGFAQTMEAITGMAWVTGWVDGPPVLPRGPCDPLAALHAVFATMLALRDRETSGEGRLIEVTMIEAALNMAAEQVVEYGATGTVLERRGNRGPGAAPQNVYACAGHEQWLALAIATDEQWHRLREVLGDPEWAREPALATIAGRFDAHDTIDAELSRCFAARDARELAEELASRGVPAGYVIDARETARNPQMRHRGFFEIEDHPVTGRREVPVLPFRFRDLGRPWMRRPSPMLGQHNAEILGGLLDLGAAELADLEAAGIIGTRPVGT